MITKEKIITQIYFLNLLRWIKIRGVEVTHILNNGSINI